jgi:hypothetical protein
MVAVPFMRDRAGIGGGVGMGRVPGGGEAGGGVLPRPMGSASADSSPAVGDCPNRGGEGSLTCGPQPIVRGRERERGEEQGCVGRPRGRRSGRV